MWHSSVRLRLLVLLLVVTVALAAIPKRPGAVKVASNVKVHGPKPIKDDYFQKGHRFLQKKQWEAAIYCFEKDQRLKNAHNSYDHLWSIAMAYEGLGDGFQAEIFLNRAIRLQPTSANAYNQSESIRTSMRDVRLPDFRECLHELEPIDEEYWEAIEHWTKSVWLHRPDLEPNPPWLVGLSDAAVGCYLNRTFNIDDYFFNANTQVHIWAHNDRLERAERLLQWINETYTIDIMRHKVSEDLINKILLRGDRLREALEATKRALKKYPNDEWLMQTEAHIYHGLGDFKSLEKALKRSWTARLKDWLLEKPKRNCRRSLTNWFNDPEVVISKPVHLIDLISFGYDHPKYIETEENLANPVVQHMNLTYNDRPVYVLKFSNVELLPNFQLRSDCKRYYGVLVGDDLPTGSNRPVVEVDRMAITAPLQNNFFHNLLDSAARLAVLMYEVFQKDEFLDVMLLMEDNPVTRTVLELLRFPLSRVARFEPHKNILRIKELYMVDWKPIYDTTANDKAIQMFMPPRWVQMMLRQWQLEGFDKMHSQLVDKIPGMIDVVYVSRAETSVRMVRHELFLIAQLRESLESLGARLHVHRGDTSLPEQIALFRIADVVVGPHGAGLANILYCYPGTTVIEFPVLHPHWDVFGFMASALDLDYWIVPELTASLQGHFTADRQAIEATVTSVLVALELKGLV